MPKAIFLYHGGIYKHRIDSGRERVPLNHQEAELVFPDPEVPSEIDNSISTELPMSKYADLFCDLAVGDEIFVGLAPDVSVYRGLWMMSFDKVPGFTVKYDLVPVKAVYDAYVAGTPTGVAPFNTAPASLNYDFTNGLGDATIDADQLAKLYGGAYTDYRNNDAAALSFLQVPKFAKLGESLYMRITITALGDFGKGEGDCCSRCGGNLFPTFQIGALYDQLCIDKQRVRKYCNCPERLCGQGCPELVDNDPPTIDDPGPQSYVAGSPITPLVMTADETVTWFVNNLPIGLSLDTVTGEITGTPTVGGTVVIATFIATDVSGNNSEPVDVEFTITVP